LIVDGAIQDRDAGGMVTSCEGVANGISCGTSRICVNKICSESRCGDGYADEAREEQCDDGNAEGGDGCNPDCRYSCENDTDCEDNETCNGVSTCDVTTHRCVAGANLDDGTECTLRELPMQDAGMPDGGMPDGSADLDAGVDVDSSVDLDAGIEDPNLGQCRVGACVARGCGNGVQSGTEECDDGNSEDGDGCDNDCSFTCNVDEDCQNDTVCDGIETCQVATHTCMPGTAPNCVDTENTMNFRGTWGPDCTVDMCDPVMGCIHTLRDQDGDGFPASSYMIDGTQYSCLGTAANDCNDIDNTVYPGAEEICDGRDNNCVMGADEIAPTWFADCDGDGFAPLNAAEFVGCNGPATVSSCPGTATMAGWTTTRPTAGNLATFDCNDSNGDVRPAQMTFGSRIPSPGSGFDWNCDGSWEQEAPDPAPCSGGLCILRICRGSRGFCSGSLGWTDGAPACGNTGTFGYCEWLSDGSCGRMDRSRTQLCR
jgi:cysteine-rich repeat protein